MEAGIMKIVKISTTHEIHDAFPEVTYYRVNDKDFRIIEKLLIAGNKTEALSILDGKTIKIKGDLDIDVCLQ